MFRRRNPNLLVGGGQTFEHITLPGTIMGILIPGALMILVRLVLLVLFLLVVLMIGKQSGGVLAVFIALFVYIEFMYYRRAPGLSIPILLGVATLLIALAEFNYWPSILEWTNDGTQLFYRVHWRFEGFFSFLSLDTGVVTAGWVVVWLRILSVICIPMIVWNPYRFIDTALGLEITWPKARETGFSPGDPASIPIPDDLAIRGQQRSGKNDDDVQVVTIPAPTVQGQ